MAGLPYIRFYPADYLLDTAHLTATEHGYYFLLLMHCWRSPGCRIPNDPKWIARRLGVNAETFREGVVPVLDEFFKSTGNWLSQKRLTAEFEFGLQFSKNQSARGKGRKTNEKKPAPDEPIIHHTPYTKHHTKKGQTNGAGDDTGILDAKGIDSVFDSWWQTVKLKRGKGQARKAFKAALKKTDLDTIVTEYARYEDHHLRVEKTEPRFIKHVATWLNGECWADDTSAARGNGRTPDEDAEVRRLKRAIMDRDPQIVFPENEL